MKLAWHITPANRLPEFREAWDDLNRRLHNGHPLLDSRFVAPLVQHFGAATDRLVVGTQRGKPVAMALLTPKRFGVWQTFLPSQAPIAPVLLERGVAPERLLAGLGPTALCIDFLQQDPHFSRLDPARPRSTRWFASHGTTTSVRLQGAFDDYWQARSKKLRYNIGRSLRQLDVEGVVMTVRERQLTDELQQAVATYGVLESLGWKGQAGTALHPSNAQGRFYRDVLAAFAQEGQARAYELWLGDHCAASRLAIRGSDMVVMLKTTYDESLARFRPGWVLLREVLQLLFHEQPTRTVEFYTSASAEQMAWATANREIFHASVTRSPVDAAVLRGIAGVRRRVGAMVSGYLARHRAAPRASPS
jgi:CelD/BcsL family acetyltransferase involved in cellulose biosynthesis